MLWQPHVVRVSSSWIEPGTGSKGATHPGTPLTFGGWEELPRGAIEEEEEEMDAVENDDADQATD